MCYKFPEFQYWFSSGRIVLMLHQSVTCRHESMCPFSTTMVDPLLQVLYLNDTAGEASSISQTWLLHSNFGLYIGTWRGPWYFYGLTVLWWYLASSFSYRKWIYAWTHFIFYSKFDYTLGMNLNADIAKSIVYLKDWKIVTLLCFF